LKIEWASESYPDHFFALMLSILGLRLLPVFSRSGRIASIYTGPQVSCLNQDKKQIARVAAHENGNYPAALPLENYVLDVQDRRRRHVRATPQPFTIVSNQTVRVDMDIIAVDQWRAGSTQSFRPD